MPEILKFTVLKIALAVPLAVMAPLRLIYSGNSATFTDAVSMYHWLWQWKSKHTHTRKYWQWLMQSKSRMSRPTCQ